MSEWGDNEGATWREEKEYGAIKVRQIEIMGRRARTESERMKSALQEQYICRDFQSFIPEIICLGLRTN